MSRIAELMYPNLAKGDDQPKQSDRGQVGRPGWGRSTDPAWIVRELPPVDYSVVPGLVKISKQRR